MICDAEPVLCSSLIDPLLVRRLDLNGFPAIFADHVMVMAMPMVLPPMPFIAEPVQLLSVEMDSIHLAF